MRINHVRKRLAAGEPSIGTWLSLPSPEAAKNALEIADMLHRVTIDTADTRIREEFTQIRLNTLRTFPDVVDIFALTICATRWGPFCQAAVMTDQPVDGSMVGQ